MKNKVLSSNTCAVLGGGKSMSMGLVNAISANFDTIAINNTGIIAPESIALVAQDRKWWGEYGSKLKRSGFNGLVYSCIPVNTNDYTFKIVDSTLKGKILEGTEAITPNSGALGIYISSLFYDNILLFGFNMTGDHWFGRYPDGLRNIEDGSERHKMMFTEFNNVKNIVEKNPRKKIYNCTENSAIECFNKISFTDAILMHDDLSNTKRWRIK